MTLNQAVYELLTHMWMANAKDRIEILVNLNDAFCIKCGATKDLGSCGWCDLAIAREKQVK